MTRRGDFEVEVRPAIAPDGRTMVLLQLPDGHILMNPEDATKVALLIIDTVMEIALAEAGVPDG